MNSFNVLDENTDIWGRKVLQASAGTGKTFAIEHIYLRLLLERGDRSLKVPEILVVTFTKAAARELKARIRKNIEHAFSFPYVEKLGSPEKIKKTLKEALFFFDDAQIFTIHGFCKRSLEEFTLQHQGLFEEKKEMVSLLPYIRRFFRQITPDILLSQQVPILYTNEKKLEDLFSYFQKNIGKKVEAPPSWDELLQKIAVHLRKFSIQSDLFWEDFEKLFPLFKIQKLDAKRIRKDAELLLEILQDPSIDKCGSLSLDITSFFSEQNLKKRCNVPSLHYPEFFQWIGKELRELILPFADQDLLKDRLLYYLQKFVAEEDQFFSYDEILLKMHEAVQHSSFREGIQGKYKAVIIDEFQDTDKLQWEIFHSIFLKEQMSEVFYIVGDPKQAIYGFRQGDVYTYLQAALSLGDQNLFHLDTNFRSIPSLVHALNSFFSKRKEFILLPKTNASLPYLPVKAGVMSDFDFEDGKKPLHFFLGESTSTLEGDQLFPNILNEIRSLQEKGLDLQDFAILVKDRYQGKRLEEFFQRQGLPSQRKKHLSLKESIALPHLKEILRAVSTPLDESRVRLALLSPYIGYSLKEIAEMEESLPKEPFYLLQRTFQEEGIAGFFSAFLETVWKNKVVDEIKKDPLFYQETILAISHLLEVNLSLSLNEWISLIDEWENKDDEMKGQSCSENGISILTMHKSKGLEFEVVFALGLASLTEIKDVEEEAEKQRLLYVSMTRAKKRLYVPYIINDKEKYSSPIELFFPSKMSMDSALQFFSSDPSWSFSTLSPMILEQKDNVCDQSIDQPKVALPKEERRKIYSFSSLKGDSSSEKTVKASSLLPKGPEFGTFVHSLLEKVLLLEVITELEVEKIVLNEAATSSFANYKEMLVPFIQRALFTPFTDDPNFFLANIPFEKRLVEVEFFSPFLRDYLKGYIDLVFNFEGKYYLLDWKTNDLNDYENIDKVLEGENYHLQAAIYADAFQKVVMLLDPNPSFGGMFFIFLRGLEKGQGISHFFPDTSLLTKLL
ncbi:MAG TPA: UvrD-helicase domain-containing protein [Chlamydiales bacterium]|nr:UvrD-helicase domain-containing protein [Chlamydiales bacterium]